MFISSTLFSFRQLFCIFILLFFCSNSLGAEENNNSTILPEKTYFLAIGACPPWIKNMGHFCENTVDSISKTLRKRAGIPQKNIKLILDSEATYQGVEDGFSWILNNTDANSIVIIYFNTHGLIVPEDGKIVDSLWQKFMNRNTAHETLVLWTEKKPLTILDAIEKKQWMLAKHIREMLDKISAEKIVIIDACYSGMAKNDLLKYQSLTPALNKREAFIFSSLPIVPSYTELGSETALFTTRLVEAIHYSKNLEDAFWKARRTTAFNSFVELHAENEFNKGACLINAGNNLCIQLPLKEDKNDILAKIQFKNYSE